MDVPDRTGIAGGDTMNIKEGTQTIVGFEGTKIDASNQTIALRSPGRTGLGSLRQPRRNVRPGGG